MPKDSMARRSGGVIRNRRDQLATTQMGECDLDCAFRETRCISDRAKTRCDWLPPAPRRPGVKMKIDQISSLFLIVRDQIAHQDV
jgi:hypothetical protein